MQTSYDIEANIRTIGEEIFDLAGRAEPGFWRKAWWTERATRWLDGDDKLRTRAFQFVDCLPMLRTDESLARHLQEYFAENDAEPSASGMDRAVRLFVTALGPGPWQQGRRRAASRLAHFGAQQMAGRFIAGYNVASVIASLKELRRRRMAFTLDVLGESITSDQQADRYVAHYHDLIESISREAESWVPDPILDISCGARMPRANFSIKLTGLDPHCDPIRPDWALQRIRRRLDPLLDAARKCGAFVNIDMESTRYRSFTLDVFIRLASDDRYADWTGLGIVVQAYLKDAESDLQRLIAAARVRKRPFTIRLVKGAYWDAEIASAVRRRAEPPVWTQKWQSDAAYEKLSATMLQNSEYVRPAFASHNVRSLAAALAHADRLGLPPSAYEVQMLHGMGDPLKVALARMGRCVRVYCPYGDLMQGMAYLIRRLLENTSNEGFLKQSFGDHSVQNALLVDPSAARPPSAALPARFDQNTDPEERMSGFINASSTDFTVLSNQRKMQDALIGVRSEFGREWPVLIDGETVASDDWFESLNPSNGREVVGRIAMASAADVDRAAASARKSFTMWRATSASVRADMLRRTADNLERRRFELAATMVLEVGKPWRESDADVTEAVDHCRYYAEQIERYSDHPRMRNTPGEDNTLVYSPKGVCAVISPWPFPLAVLAGMTAAALAGGNCVVIKPARHASVCAAKFVRILLDSGCPEGVVAFVPGYGAVVGRCLVQHENVDLVAFTGSAETGADVIRASAAMRAGQRSIRKTIVEMGGKNAIIVDDDADLDAATAGIMESAFAFAGQKCSSCSRLIVLQDVWSPLAERIHDAVASLTIGSAESPSSFVGPLIDREAVDRVGEYVRLGRKEGKVLVEGLLPGDVESGFFVAPAVITNLAENSRITQEEILGPILAMHRAVDFDHAIAIANGTRFALTGGVYSRSPGNIDLARREFAVGNLYINRKITGSQVDAQPFGGFRLSGTGVKAGSPEYLLHFMDARCITENTLRSGFVPSARKPGKR